MPTPTGRSRPALSLTIIALLAIPAAAAAAPPPERLPGDRRPGQALERVHEMIGWIEKQEMPPGGWHAEPRFGMDGNLRLDWSLAGRLPDPDVITTAMVGVTLLRTRDRAGRTPYNEALAEAIRYVTGAVDLSPSATLDLDARLTPISARVGTYIDTALALLLLAEATEPRTPTHAGRLGAQIEKLIRKLEDNQREDGTWGDGAYNSPLLGHALAVWALEAASRKGHKVDPDVLARAGAWALGEASGEVEHAAAGKWKGQVGRRPVPEWLAHAKGREDDEPINHELYEAAARLSVLAQADRSNRALETQLLLTARSTADAARRAEAARSLLAIKKTRASLAAAQEAVLAVLLEDRGTAPLAYTAEDFLACLLLTDSLPPATAERWFPPTVKRLMRWQETDGGLKSEEMVTCSPSESEDGLAGPCTCEGFVQQESGFGAGPAGMRGRLTKGRQEARLGAAGKGDKPSLERQYCPDYRSYCSRDRVFCTAVAVAAILADTPYKPAMLRGTAPRAAAAPGR